MRIAISRQDDCAYIADMDANPRRQGIYQLDGKLIRGELVLPENEAAFRIWLQTQPVTKSNRQLAEQWNKMHPENQIDAGKESSHKEKF